MAFLVGRGHELHRRPPVKSLLYIFPIVLLLGILMKVCMDDTISERCSLSPLKGTEEKLSVHRRRPKIVALGQRGKRALVVWFLHLNFLNKVQEAS